MEIILVEAKLRELHIASDRALIERTARDTGRVAPASKTKIAVAPRRADPSVCLRLAP